MLRQYDGPHVMCRANMRTVFATRPFPKFLRFQQIPKLVSRARPPASQLRHQPLAFLPPPLLPIPHPLLPLFSQLLLTSPAKPPTSHKMPPKKATATKKAAATTAAGNRPKRATAPVAEKQADTKTSGAGKSSHEQSRASRPRPSDLTTSAAANTGKKRGRPAKASEDVDIAEPPRKRGRPAKASENVDVTEPPRKRGRPSKASEPATPAASSAPAEKRGRPAKKEAPAVSKTDAPPPKKRGRPPKGGETTKIDTDDQAAAEQLEEELVDAVEEPKAPAKRGQGRPPKKAGGKKAAAIANDEDSDMADGVHETAVGTQYWLMKAEQEDREEVLKDGSVYNTKFTIDDLRDKAGPEPWDGMSYTASFT